MSKETKEGKARITITLRNDLLPLLDNFIDGEKIRNRSHAIEFILGQHLGVGIKTAVILAGSDEDGHTHALTSVRHRPVIEYLFESLKEFGIRHVVLVIDNNGAELKEHVGDGSQWGIRATVVNDAGSNGTAAALKLVEPLIDQTFLLLYSDVLARINLNDLVEHHKASDSVGTVALTYKRSIEEYGVARMEGSKIVEFSEKPGKDSPHGLVNAGIYLFEPEVFSYMKDTDSLETQVLPPLAEQGELSGYPFQGKWYDIATQNGRSKAENDWGN